MDSKKNKVKRHPIPETPGENATAILNAEHAIPYKVSNKAGSIKLRRATPTNLGACESLV